MSQTVAEIPQQQHKEELTRFLIETWRRSVKEVLVTVGAEWYRLCDSPTNDIGHVIPGLHYSQTEADVRLLLHAGHAASDGHQAIIICSCDTDVQVLAIYFQQQISGNFYILKGTQAHLRLVNINTLARSWGQNVCNALPWLHSFTGSDIASAYYVWQREEIWTRANHKG